MSNTKNKPASGKGAKRKKVAETLSTRRAVKWFWIIISAPFAILILLLALISAGAFGKLPTFEELENPKSNLATEIYTEDGKTLGSFFIENRSFVDYTELNDSLVAALVSTEDARFYSHSGIDFISLARVGLKTVAMGRRDQGGGSTITQQLAKNLFRIREQTEGDDGGKSNIVIFKLKEWITAVRLEYNYTKEEIIAMYLNTVEYGSNAFGIKAAAQTFFNKAPAELSINEAAMMVGVVNAPTRYSPVRNPENAFARRNTVLTRMQAGGFIDRQERDSLAALPIKLDYRPISHNEGEGTYFREMLRLIMNMKRPTRGQYGPGAAGEWDFNQAAREWDENPLYGFCIKNTKPDGTPYNIYRDGLKIYTTINSEMQRYAEEAVQDRLANDIQPSMDRELKAYKTLFINTGQADADRIVNNAIRQSDRYRAMKADGATDQQIEDSFNTEVEMKIFSYKGDIDTLMTPRDSVLYHKAILRASFMAMDPSNGHIKAYVGGPNFRYFKYDMVRQGRRQVGSTIKPFIYAFAISYLGFTPCTPVLNEPVTIDADGRLWSPKEASSRDDIYDGKMYPLQWGLRGSRNNYSAWIMKQSKNPSAVADFIHKMGVQSYIDPVYALCLGTMDLSLMELVGSYSTFANRGVHTDPIFVTRIEDNHGNLIASFTPSSTDAINEQTAYTMLNMLKYVVTSGTAIRLRSVYGFMGDIGGKTGTSQENRDAWFVGVTPNLVAGVWVGGEDQQVHLRSNAEGSARALPIFAEFMKRVYDNPRLGITQEDKFLRPAGAVDYNCTSAIEEDTSSSPAAHTPDEFFD